MLGGKAQTQPVSVRALNDASKDDYMHLVGGVVENSPWVADLAFVRRPFLSVDDLNAKLIACIADAPDAQKIALFNLHPELAGREAIAGDMTASSTGEQGRLGLTRLQSAEHARLAQINSQYRAKFGFPLIVALRLHDSLDSVLRAGEARLSNSIQLEMAQTLEQISAIVYGRLCKIFPRD